MEKCSNIGTSFIVPILIFKDRYIVRCRENQGKELFANISELSYPPANITKLNRASLPKETMFYGTYLEDEINGLKENIRTSIVEVTPEVSDFNFQGLRDYTISIWKTKEIIPVYVYYIDDTFENLSELGMYIRENWKKVWQKDDVSEQEKEMIKYYGNLMVKRGSEEIYSKTAKNTQFILRNHPTLQGLMYPSVNNKGKQLCVALKPNVVDKVLQFEKAIYVEYSRENENESKINVINRACADLNGHLWWKEGGYYT